MNCNREAFMSSGVTLMWHMYYCHTKTWILARMLPWCAKSLQEGDNCWDIDNPPERDLNLREQNWHRDGEAVVDECHCMSSNLPDEEEIVPQVNFTPQWHFLHNKKSYTCQPMLWYFALVEAAWREYKPCFLKSLPSFSWTGLPVHMTTCAAETCMPWMC